MKGPFFDGLRSLVSSITNNRQASAANEIRGNILTWEQQREIYRTGLGNKIVRLKAGDSMAPDSLEFERREDQDWFEAGMARKVREAVKWMLVFGRGIIILQDPRGDLRSPLPDRADRDKLVYRVFSGDMITTNNPDVNLESPRYLKPQEYYVRGVPIHHSRVVDFTYVEPPEFEAPIYQYGGISEYDLIYQQLIADGVVERATPSILEKNSNLFYRVKGLKDLIRDGREKDVLKFFRLVEEQRSMYGAGLIDMEDEVQTVEQTLTNLSEADQITLRRISMVTGISITRLVGENVRGLNSSGDTERQSDRATISALQNDYILPPLQDLMDKLGRGKVEFGQALAETPGERADYEQKILKNAGMLFELGQDHEQYLEDHGLIQKDAWDQMFAPPEEESEPEIGVVGELQSLFGPEDDDGQGQE